LAKRRLKDELDKADKVDPKLARMNLEELLRLYEGRLSQYETKTAATRHSILKIFKKTWGYGLAIPVREISTGQLELWLGKRRANVRNSTFNEYARFIRQLFELAVKLRVLAESPALGIKGLRVETPIRLTPNWQQFQAIVREIRAQKLSADSEDSADLVEFMGLAGVGTAECANLMGENVDIPGNRITLYRKKTDTGYTIPIFPQLLALIQKLNPQAPFQAGQPVFRVRDPKKALAAACHRLGFPAFSPRSLRRCFITRAIELGVDFKTIASWQGHRDGGVLIAKTYSHLRNEHSDAMAKKLVAG
jgi:integrase